MQYVSEYFMKSFVPVLQDQLKFQSRGVTVISATQCVLELPLQEGHSHTQTLCQFGPSVPCAEEDN